MKGRAPRVVCRPGPRGPKGKSGWPGPSGFIGQVGAPGVDGQNGTLSETRAFINVFIDQPVQGIEDNTMIPFNLTEALSDGSDFTFDDATGAITIQQDGVYYATFMVAARGQVLSDPTVFGLYVGGTLVSGCKYLSKSGKYYVFGQCLFPAAAADNVSLVNLSGATVSLWQSDIENFPFIAVKASLMMYKVSNTNSVQTVSSS